MIVNSAYMYMVSAVEKVIKLFDKGSTKYAFTVDQGAASLNPEGLNLNPNAKCSFAGVDLRERTSIVIDWLNTNYPGGGNIYVYFKNSSGQQLHGIGLRNDESVTKTFTKEIPQNCRIENATIQFYAISRTLLSRVEIS